MSNMYRARVLYPRYADATFRGRLPLRSAPSPSSMLGRSSVGRAPLGGAGLSPPEGRDDRPPGRRTTAQAPGRVLRPPHAPAISRLITQGQFESLDYPIAHREGRRRLPGQRAGRAAGGQGLPDWQRQCPAPIPAYAMEELRREASERNYGRMVAAWTRREHTMLQRMTDAHVRVPQPYGRFRNVLVMEFIGTDELPGPAPGGRSGGPDGALSRAGARPVPDDPRRPPCPRGPLPGTTSSGTRGTP